MIIILFFDLDAKNLLINSHCSEHRTKCYVYGSEGHGPSFIYAMRTASRVFIYHKEEKDCNFSLYSD